MLESQQKKLNSPVPQYFHDSFSVSPIQHDQPSTLKTSMECFRETQLRQLVNIYTNEETLLYQPLTNSDISNSIDLTQNSCYFRNQDSISAHPIELDQTQTCENPIDILASYPFSKIELKHEYDPEINLVIQFLFLTQ